MPAADFSAYAAKLDAAARRVDPDPTPAKREAFNYRHGVLHAHGMTVMIEVPKGGTRRGVGPDGKAWAKEMKGHYGRIKRTVGRDGEPVDVFLGDHPESQLVFVISQLDKDGNLDEHKCCLFTRNVAEARKLYLAHYPPDWARTRTGEVRGYTMEQFKKWLKTDAPVKHRRKAASVVPLGDTRESVVDGFMAALAAKHGS